MNYRNGETPTIGEVVGATLHCQVAGTGHPVFLLHGGLVDSEMWDGEFTTFAEHYKVVRYDRRGFGNPSGGGSVTHLADLRAVLQRLGIGTPDLVGPSGGAALTVDFTLRYPDLVHALVLVAPGLGGYGGPMSSSRITTSLARS